MNVRKRIRQLPVRLAVGSYMVNSGLSKWNADETTAKELQAFAAGSYPFLAKLDPQLFVNALAAAEVAIILFVFFLTGITVGIIAVIAIPARRPKRRLAPGKTARGTWP